MHTEGAFPSSSPIFVGDGKVDATPAPPPTSAGGGSSSANGEDDSKANSGGDTLGVKLSEHKPPRVNGVFCPVVVASPPAPGVATASSERDEGPSIDVGEVGSRGHSLPVAVATGSQQQQHQRRQIVRGVGVERTVAVRGALSTSASVTVPSEIIQLPAGAGVAALASAISPAAAVASTAAASRSSPQAALVAPATHAAAAAQSVEGGGRIAVPGAAAAMTTTTAATSSAVLQTATIVRGGAGSVHLSNARPIDVVTRSRRGERQSMAVPEEHVVVAAAEMGPVHKGDSGLTGAGRNESIDLSSSVNSMDVLDEDGSGDNDDDDGGVLL